MEGRAHLRLSHQFVLVLVGLNSHQLEKTPDCHTLDMGDGQAFRSIYLLLLVAVQVSYLDLVKYIYITINLKTIQPK
jgi:hypothetical protein